MKKLNYFVVCAVALATLSVGVSSCEGRSGNRNSTGNSTGNSSSGGGSSGGSSSSSRSSNPYLGTWKGKWQVNQTYSDMYEISILADGTAYIRTFWKDSRPLSKLLPTHGVRDYDAKYSRHSESYHGQVYEWIRFDAGRWALNGACMTKDGKVYAHAPKNIHDGKVRFILTKTQ